MRLECSDPETSDRPMAPDVLLRREPEEEEEEDEGDGNEGDDDDEEEEDGYSE
jgi:hypothetical protein